MSEHAIRTATGSFRIIDGDGSHIVLTNEEFHDIVKISRMYRDDVKHFSKENTDLKIKLAGFGDTLASLQSKLDSAEMTIRKLSRQKGTLEQEVASYKEEIESLKRELSHAEALNTNLRRICRERANQARGLPRAADGYIVLTSREIRERAQDGSPIRGYKTAIQSPISASTEAAVAKKEIYDTLMDGVLADLGIFYCEPVNGRMKTQVDVLTVYRRTYVANYKTGLWEINICTNGPITVPENRTPVQTQKRRNGGKGK